MSIAVVPVRFGADETRLLERILQFSSLEYLEVNDRGDVLRTNAAFARHVGLPQAELCGVGIERIAPAADAARVIAWAAGADLPQEPVLLNFIAHSQAPYTVSCIFSRRDRILVVVGDAVVDTVSTAEEMMRLNNEFATLVRETARRSRELEVSYWHLKKIQEALPVCMDCGQVKGDGSRWEPVVEYLRKNRIFLSHGYCPGCFDALVTDLEARGEL